MSRMIECASVVVRVQERVRMPRYFFNFVGNEGSVLDTRGVELTDIATVRTYAHKRAAELAEAAGQDKDISGWRIQICDETGLPVMSLAAESERPGATEPGLACSNVQGVSQTER